ncbi:MAG TPA: hypothetical protein VFV50_15415 [Bdellovibrionales bacterium]|nr:hypothetical protein [Bdellovibrionales bacterium]
MKLLLVLSLVTAFAMPVYANDLAYSQEFMSNLAADEAGAEMSADDNPAFEDMQRRPRRPRDRDRNRRRRNEPWYFLGCTNSDFNCSWAATRYRCTDYRTEWDIRCRSAAYACYVRNCW